MNLPVAAMTAIGVFDFTVTASDPAVDAVIGLSSGEATWFPDIAAAVRLAPSGQIDARDGAGYRVDLARTYGTTSLSFHVVADLTSHTYSVIQGSFTFAEELARQYAFRTEQQAVTSLDHVAIVVDGDAGSVEVCGISATPSTGVAYSREGNYRLTAVGGGQVVLATDAALQLLDASGHTIAQATPGGVVGSDAAGNLSAARISGTTLVVDHYGPGLVATGQSSVEVGAGATIQDVSRAHGDAYVALAQGTSNVVVQASMGASHAIHGGLAVLDGDEAVVLYKQAGSVRVARYSATGAVVWGRVYVGDADLTALAVDASHRVVFGGELLTSINFGSGALPLVSNPDHAVNGFVAEISAAGNPVFGVRTDGSWVGGISTNGAQIVVSGTLWRQYPHYTLQAYDPTGAAVALPAFDLGFTGDHLGRGGAVAVDASNHVWWNLQHQWMLTPQFGFLFAL